MHQVMEQIPLKFEGPETTVRATGAWGGMVAVYSEFPAGTDLGPLLKGLPGGVCPCPCWGYLIKGKLRISHSSGDDEVVKAGEVFYTPPGNVMAVEEDAAIVYFSPEACIEEVLGHTLKKVGA